MGWPRVAVGESPVSTAETEAATYLKARVHDREGPRTWRAGRRPKAALDAPRQILIERSRRRCGASLGRASWTSADNGSFVGQSWRPDKERPAELSADYVRFNREAPSAPSPPIGGPGRCFRGRKERILQLALKLPEELRGTDGRVPRHPR